MVTECTLGQYVVCSSLSVQTEEWKKGAEKLEHDQAVKLAADLRAFADFIEQSHEAIPEEGVNVKISTYVWHDRNNPDTIAGRFAPLIRAGLAHKSIDGVHKDYSGNYFELHLAIGDLDYEIWCTREAVCEKRVVGTETVTEKVAVKYEEREIEKEIVEWDCHPLLKS
jgi:hypothetical protein